MAPILAFVHVPRTGGGSASDAISQGYARMKSAGNAQRNPDKTESYLRGLAVETKLPQVIGDHIPLGLYRRYLPRDTRYMTFLRDPVERVLSHHWLYACAAKERTREIWERLAALDGRVDLTGVEDYTLEEGLARGLPVFDNLQVRYLCGATSVFGPLERQATKRARQHVSRFFFVGISERLDESLVMLARALGTAPLPYVRRHSGVGGGRPAVDDSLRALVAEHNRADIELYREARKRFDERAARVDGLAEEAAALRAASEKLTAEAAARPRERGAKRTLRRASAGRRADEQRVEVDDRAEDGEGHPAD
jgi:hypothetical protein